jgi:hypothetical protein
MKRLSPSRITLLALLGVALVAGSSAAGAQTAHVGGEFRLKAGRTVTLDGGALRLRFASVPSDSRCPVDVDCVWAGNAEVMVEAVGRGGLGKKTLRLNTNAGGERAGEATYGRYTVKLLALSPQPRSGRKLAAREYTAALLVVKE